jgi:hypothetical protein
LLELKKAAIIISLGIIAFLMVGIMGCAPVRSKSPGTSSSLNRVGLIDSVEVVKSTIAQTKQDSTNITKGITKTDTTILASSEILPDSIAADTLSNPDDLQYVVKYTSEDSTIMDVERKEVHLYGNAEVNYGTINLKADYIKLNWLINEVYAIGTYDSTTTKMKGDPIFQDGQETYNTKNIRYNFKTKKAIIGGIVTQQGDGNIRGEKVKKDKEGNFYIQHSMYTTCNLEHPHFYINAPKIKMVHQKQIISGPFNLVISDVPLPIGLPFGFFPFPKKKEIGTSGIIFPTYGQEPNGRGFYLRDGGYYFAISEYVNATVTGQIYSTGSWGLGLASTYSKRYQYNGSLSLRFNNNLSPDEVEKAAGRGKTNDFSIQWSHAPKARGSSTFSANVNVNSNSYNQYQELNTQKYISNVATSSVQYSKTAGQYLRGSASLRVNQNFGATNSSGRRSNGETNIASDFSLGINQIAPLALRNPSGRWYESFRMGFDFSGNYALTNVLSAINTSYSSLGFRVDNQIDTARANKRLVTSFNIDNLPDMLKDAQFTGRYSLPISLPNFKVLKFVNVTPSLSLSGDVYTKQYHYSYKGGNTVHIDTLNQMGTQYQYAFGTSINTRFYGTKHFGGRKLEAIRHTVIPMVSFTYTPDFTGDNFGFYQTVQVNELGKTQKLSRFRGIGNGAGNGRASSVIAFSLNNSLEMKLKSSSDTAATQFKKVSLLDNLSFSGNYNLLADSLNLSNIAVGAATRIGKNLNVNFNMTLDPYAYQLDPNNRSSQQVGRKINKFAITEGQGLVGIQNLGFTFGTNFAPKGSDKSKKTNPSNTGNKLSDEQREFIQQNPNLYVDFDIPWTLTLNYNFAMSKPGLSKATLVQAAQATGDLSLSKNFKISVNTGFDFTAFKPTITTLTLYRDLHCWDMSMSWTPFAGSSQRVSNYNFTLKVKSSILQDLKLTRRRSFQDRATY